METLLAQAGQLFNWVLNNMTTIVTIVTGSPLLLVGLLISLTGLCIGVFKRLTNVV